MLFLFNFVKSLFLPVQSIEEEYKHVVNEEVSQLNKSIASKEMHQIVKKFFKAEMKSKSNFSRMFYTKLFLVSYFSGSF